VADESVKEDSSKGVLAGSAAAGGVAPGLASGAPATPETPGSSPPKSSSSSSPSPSSSDAKIPIDDFLKLDLRVGEVIAAEKVEKSKKLMKMTVKIGEEVRTIVGGIALAYGPEQLVGKKFVFVANLAPARLMGVESNGMILAATLPETGAPSLLMVDPAVPSGAKVK
jgi:methionyl-tRNA synthetase